MLLASFSLMVPQAPSAAQAGNARASTMANWRVMMGVCTGRNLFPFNFAGGLARSVDGGDADLRPPCRRRAYSRIREYGLIQGIFRYFDTLDAVAPAFASLVAVPTAPIVVIDIVAGIRRHAASLHG